MTIHDRLRNKNRQLLLILSAFHWSKVFTLTGYYCSKNLDLFDSNLLHRFDGRIFAEKRLKPSPTEHRRKNCFVLLIKNG
jgi:hypothetical protein